MTLTTGRYQNVERLVVKVGTGFLFHGNDNGSGYRFRGEQLDGLLADLYPLTARMGLAIVSSGAIAMHAYRRGLPEVPKDPHKKAQFSCMGQPYLYMEYAKRFELYGKQCAQGLLTYNELTQKNKRENLIRNQNDFFADGVIAIYNENDLVTLQEISHIRLGFGDNDILAARFACLIKAGLLVMLSHPVEGLGAGGGKSKGEARKILSRQGIPIEIFSDRYEQASDSSGIWKPKIRELFPYSA